ncbi:monoglyceride lipase-like isoform X2 [Dermacentor albipictus]|uniref:monoglyceride lipase-like isoform X2 n=1 Tax=Dermacentor albipictus TaxID=60249 RepID=UPI0038FD399D
MSNESIRVDDRTSFLNEDGHNIVCTTWRTDAEPRALLFVAHGYGDYSQDQAYKALAYATVGLGFYVFSHDHVGHGKSEGPRGTIRSFDIYLQDILTHIDMEQAKFPGKPVYLFGHSMGGLLVILAALRRPRGFAGMVLMSPLLGLNTPYYSRFTTYLARLLVCIMPCLPTATASVDQSCRDAAVVNRMNNDPLYYVGSVCLRWVVAMVDAIEATRYATLKPRGTSSKRPRVRTRTRKYTRTHTTACWRSRMASASKSSKISSTGFAPDCLLECRPRVNQARPANRTAQCKWQSP